MTATERFRKSLVTSVAALFIVSGVVLGANALTSAPARNVNVSLTSDDSSLEPSESPEPSEVADDQGVEASDDASDDPSDEASDDASDDHGDEASDDAGDDGDEASDDASDDHGDEASDDSGDDGSDDH